MEEFIEQLEQEIAFEKRRETNSARATQARGTDWTKDYQEGYIDGLKQAVAMAKE